MNKTKIEMYDYTINPVKGLCPMACPYCYARRLYKRFKWNPELRLDLSVFDTLPKRPSRIFVGSTMELFHDDIPDDWRWGIFEYCKVRKQHTFIFLTKQPQNLIKWSPFPENCWVGASATTWLQFSDALGYLATIKAKVRFLSFEPLLERIQFDMLQKMLFPRVINWLIIGQQTPISAKTRPKIEWIQEIVEAADKAGIPVFLKDNLRPLLESTLPKGMQLARRLTGLNIPKMRQEFPKLK